MRFWGALLARGPDIDKERFNDATLRLAGSEADSRVGNDCDAERGLGRARVAGGEGADTSDCRLRATFRVAGDNCSSAGSTEETGHNSVEFEA